MKPACWRASAMTAVLVALALAVSGLGGCGGGGGGGTDGAPTDGACAIQWTSGTTQDLCAVTSAAHCTDWAAGLSGTQQFQVGATCQQLGYTFSCADGYLHRAACVDACSGHATCSVCSGAGGCGWCATSSTCLSGTTSGPGAGACADWDWLPSACAAPADPCATSAACSACTARSSCGWCASSSQCQTGTSAGPGSGSCGDWAWVSSSCGGGGSACDACISSCQGLPSCCTGTGCICEDECSTPACGPGYCIGCNPYWCYCEPC